MAKTQKAGWYPDPQDGGQKRRGSLIIKVALGIILAIVLLVVVGVVGLQQQ